MKSTRRLLSCLTGLALVAITPAANAACENGADSCVTRTERSWSHSLQVNDRAIRVQVQTWGWVWDYENGVWVWQALVQETASKEHQDQEDYTELSTTSFWSNWNW